ncbi:MAG: YadA-like family protein, partial [Dialister sp.]|nr:YadA-like family protein [Dialister sp.]
TTIKGNTITTGKVTMDYAEVMKDLGVHGNAKVDQNLEVGGTSTLKGDVTMESNATVKKDLKVEGTTTTKTLKVTENAEIDGTLKVAKKATFEDSVSIAKDLSVGGDVTAKSYKVGDKTYIDANGINANDQKITNVADGSISEGSKDAVNGGQLYGVKRDLEHQVDKVGANAAAMANLRPMEFDPSSKWNIAAAIGNYGSETAAALGAFYRPNDDVMVNLSTAFGTGENMVGGGVSVRLGKGGNKLSREENNALKDQVNDLTARMDALLSVLNPNMSKDFPDVPENHWAYEAVSRLAGNDIVQGYPDGEFHGERTMTRYEMAEIIYNALSRGAEAEKELVEEFKPELQAMAASEKATAEKAEG